MPGRDRAVRSLPDMPQRSPLVGSPQPASDSRSLVSPRTCVRQCSALSVSVSLSLSLSLCLSLSLPPSLPLSFLFKFSHAPVCGSAARGPPASAGGGRTARCCGAPATRPACLQCLRLSVCHGSESTTRHDGLSVLQSRYYTHTRARARPHTYTHTHTSMSSESTTRHDGLSVLQPS
jgi:hypothetical protein